MDKGRLRVLLVEDDPDDYLLTTELLNEIPGNKIALEWAKDFDEGLAAIVRCEHDAVLLDYRLGKGDGLVLLREGLRQGCHAPVILLTGDGDRDLALQALEAGAADYLVKGEIDAIACDLIISDLGLPDGDGHELMAELHHTYGLPGIALSGYGMDADVARSRQSGFFAHLTKPLDIHALESAIAAAPHPVSS